MKIQIKFADKIFSAKRWKYIIYSYDNSEEEKINYDCATKVLIDLLIDLFMCRLGRKRKSKSNWAWPEMYREDSDMTEGRTDLFNSTLCLFTKLNCMKGGFSEY